jgi:hypothetical protein
MPELLLFAVIALLVASLYAVMTRNRGGELPDEDSTLDVQSHIGDSRRVR